MSATWCTSPLEFPMEAADSGPLRLGKHKQLSLSSTDKCGIVGFLGLLGKARLPLCPRCERLCISSQTGYVPKGSKPVPQDSLRVLLCGINKCPTWVVLEGAEVQTNRAMWDFFPLNVYTCCFFLLCCPGSIGKGEETEQGKESHFPPPAFDYSYSRRR